MRRTDRVLSWLVWLLLPLGIGVDLVVAGWSLEPNRVAVTWFCVVFFGVLCARLVLAALRRRTRRGPVILLLAGLVMWCIESARMQSGVTSGNGVGHLAAGEALFLTSYALFALYLVLDVDQSLTRVTSPSLDAVIVCGGSVCATGLIVSASFGGRDTVALVAVLYPVLDLALAGLLGGQVVLRMRRRDRRSRMLGAGFLVLAVADLTFLTRLTDGSDASTVLTIALWGVGFALLISAACSDREPLLREAAGDVPAAVTGVSALMAVTVLVLRPELELGGALALLAAATLVATGTRLHTALRDARSAAKAIELSLTDDLTGLPNRRAIKASLAEALARRRPFALMIMDLDGFKEVNDTLGHDIGDTILTTAAARVREALPRNVLVGRLGGDEFAFVAPSDDALELTELARTALDEVKRPDFVDGIELVVAASIGVAISTPDDTEGSSMLRRADVAMYQAKGTSDGVVVYEPDSDDFTRQRLRMTEEIRRGLARGQFEVYYQPQVGAADQRIVGVEALVRWRHPGGTVQSPLTFLPTARNAGLMPLIGEAVIDSVAADLRRWRAQGTPTRVAVNCGAPELMSGIFVRQLLGAIERAALDPGDFVLEVTEDSFVSDPERVRTMLADIRAAGLQISIDDYGTGFSSLAYLRDLPVDELKIDRTFVGAMIDDARSATIVESTVRLAHALGLRVVAEGVEDAPTSAALVAMGVDVLQGFHFTRPLPADRLERWTAGWRRDRRELPDRQAGTASGMPISR